MSKINIILVVLILIFSSALVYIWTSSQAKVKLADERAKAKQVQIDLLTTGINQLKKTVEVQDTLIAENKEKLGELEAELQYKDEEHKKEIDKLKEAPPETLLAETRRILKTNEIWKEGERFYFSIDAFKKNTLFLFEGEYSIYTKTKELKKQLIQKDIIISALETKNKILEEVIKKQDERFLFQEQMIQDYRDFIKHQRRVKIFGDVVKFTIGGLVGYAIGK